MPISISMGHENADICVEFRGPVSPEDVQAYFKQLMSSFDSFADLKALLLIEDTKLIGFKFSTVFALAKLTKRYHAQLQESRTAVVTGSGLAYGFARMYIGIRDPDYPFAVFRSTNDAVGWLNAESEPEPPGWPWR